MSLWLVQALVVSFFGIITLAVVANALNEAAATGTRPTNFNELFTAIYVLVGFYVLYDVAVAISACTGCCNSGRRRATTTSRRITINDDETDDDNDTFGGPSFNARRRAAAAAAAAGLGGEFTNAEEVSGSLTATPTAIQLPVSSRERQAVLADVAIDILFAGLIAAMFAVLAFTLNRPLADENFTAFFVLFYIIQGLYILLLIAGALQTYVLDHSPAGLASGSAVLCGGVLCCCAGSQNELLDEADASIDANSASSLARKQRYAERAEFQDRPCVYLCSPYAAPSWVDWLFGVLLWAVPIGILATTILLQIYLNRAVENADAMTTTPAPTTTTATGIGGILSLDLAQRLFAGRSHHIATFAPRLPATPIDGKMLAAFAAASHAPATDPSGSTHNIDFGIVLLPIFIVLGVLILQSFCLCAMCLYRGRSAIEWLLGAIYILWLGFLLWFAIELTERVDFGPRADGLEDDGEDFHELFVPLYILFSITLVLGACGYLCLPTSYRPQRAYVSKWGVVVYRN